MFSIFMFVLFVIGLVKADSMILLASGLFAIASAIEILDHHMNKK